MMLYKLVGVYIHTLPDTGILTLASKDQGYLDQYVYPLRFFGEVFFLNLVQVPF